MMEKSLVFSGWKSDDEVIDVRLRTVQAVGGMEVVKKPKIIVKYSIYIFGKFDRDDQLYTI